MIPYLNHEIWHRHKYGNQFLKLVTETVLTFKLCHFKPFYDYISMLLTLIYTPSNGATREVVYLNHVSGLYHIITHFHTLHYACIILYSWKFSSPAFISEFFFFFFFFFCHNIEDMVTFTSLVKILWNAMGLEKFWSNELWVIQY